MISHNNFHVSALFIYLASVQLVVLKMTLSKEKSPFPQQDYASSNMKANRLISVSSWGNCFMLGGHGGGRHGLNSIQCFPSQRHYTLNS